MLRSLKRLHGDPLGALDGVIGKIKDFYFDDQSWVVRYVVADTGTWLPGRLVLLSPHAFSDFYQDGGCRTVDLTRQQIVDSPAIESHLPVSRQFEADYYRYYQYPAYWEGGAMWGMAGYPILFPPYRQENHLQDRQDSPPRDEDPHLQSAQALHGYSLQTHEGEIGRVVDFIVDEKSWEILHLVVGTGHWYAGKDIAISPKCIERVSYEESKIFVSVSKAAIQAAPECEVPPWAYQDAHNLAA